MNHGSPPPKPDAEGSARQSLQCAACAARAEATEWCVHEMTQCLMAMRNYAAGARRSSEHGEPESVAYALLSIDRQIDRAHELLTAARRYFGR